jgi:amino-acid N-acetyltransferase
MSLSIRTPLASEIPQVLQLINHESESGTVLAKSKVNPANYLVAIIDDKIVGCVGLKLWQPKLPEIVSLVVSPEFRKISLGLRLVEAIILNLKLQGHYRVFCLTGVPKFFSQLGFVEVDLDFFPDKIYGDCRHCKRNAGHPTNPLCNEVAMYLKLK